jgi:hypothetical protein
MNPIIRRTAQIVLSILLVAPFRTLGVSYQIRLHYASVPGEKYHVQARGFGKMETFLFGNGRTNHLAKELRVELEGEVQVLDIDEKGRETKITCKIATFAMAIEKERKMLLEPGTVVVLETGERGSSASVDGWKTSPEVGQALGMVLPMSARRGPDDDEIFGPGKRKKVGESWTANSDATMKRFKVAFPEANPKKVQGECRLVGVKEVGGKEFLEVSATIKAPGVEIAKPPEPMLRYENRPPQRSSPIGRGKADAEMTFWGLFSTNNSQRSPKESVTTKWTGEVDVSRFPGVNSARFSMEQTLEREFKKR